MWLDLSTYCNAACPQCHRTNPDGLGKSDWLELVQWSLDDFKKMFPIETMSHIKAFDICGTWGDPMMNKDIFEICSYIINNSSASIVINTNGSMRSDEWWWDLAVLCKKRLKVVFTVDGSTQEIHSLYRQKTDLNTILSNMQTLSMGGSTAGVFTVIFKHNQDDLINICELVQSNGANEIVFVISNRFHRKGNTEFNFKQEQHLYTLHQTDLPLSAQKKLDGKGFSFKYDQPIVKVRDIINGQ
jgi:MoaA/NifB/PqqE/SkfB family radical SAM enzyme